MRESSFTHLSSEPAVANTSYWIVVDSSTNQALYGLMKTTLKFNTQAEADNLGRQLCLSHISIMITY